MSKNNTVIKLLRTLMCFAVIVFVLVANVNVALADTDGQTQKTVDSVVQQYGPDNFPSYLSSDPQYAGNKDYAKVTYKDGNGASKSYYYKKTDEAAILNKAKSLSGQSQIENLDNLYDLSADTGTAANLTAGLQGPMRTFLGILVVFITVFMTVFTAFDLCYIAFPVFRGKMDEAKANGTRGVTKTNKNGETKLTLITDDAQYAVVASETAQTGQNAFVLYFKKRVVSFIVLAVLIFILLTGNINILTNIGVKLASGILQAISNSF